MNSERREQLRDKKTNIKKEMKTMSQNPDINLRHPEERNSNIDHPYGFGQPVFEYTSQQAVEDGILMDITVINPTWKEGLFNYVTTSLLTKGYIVDSDKMTFNIPSLLDLLNQSVQIVKKSSNNFTVFDSFFSGSIELPNGEHQRIFIAQNEAGKFTLMLPEDY
jgi:hypothetical protein